MRYGFSLVELSIVLVILGLLTGGILAGQSLIRGAELRAVATEYGKYYASINTFRDKYFGLPGDFRDATRFWGRDSAPATCTTNSGAAANASGACDGNGDGAIGCGYNTTNIATESFQVWRHLALAGLVEGTYSGTTTIDDCNAATSGLNIPRSRVSQASWGHVGNNFGAAVTNTKSFNPTGGYPVNFLLFGSERVNAGPQSGVLRAEEAWNLDTKLDDGKPGQGSVMMFSLQNWGASGSCTLGANATDFGADYRLANSSPACALFFLSAF